MRKLTIIPILSLCLAACVPGHNDYSDFKNVGAAGWRYSDVLTFKPTHEDSIVDGQLDVALRHTTDYLYSNLYLEVAYDDASGRKHTDTLNIRIADQFGRWEGQGSGTTRQLVETVNPRLVHVKDHPVTVRHIMRVDTLEGIELVGVTFTANEKKAQGAKSPKTKKKKSS